MTDVARDTGSDNRTGPALSSSSLAWGLVRTARPRQWVKNVIVIAAPGAAGILTEAEVVRSTFVALAAFCLAASGTYFLNDATDIEADRLHPRKRTRPVAAGVVPVWLARVAGAVLLLGGVLAGASLNMRLGLIVGLYVIVTVAYSLWLKEVPIVEMAAVASGFVLRAVAGGAAADVPISQWFLIVASFGSLFIVAGKRSAEHLDMGGQRQDHRRTLAAYSPGFLHYVRTLSSAVAIAAYCLWAFEKADVSNGPIWFQLSILPFVLAIMAYALRIDNGSGGAPEEILLGDHTLLFMAAAWATLFALGVYTA